MDTKLRSGDFHHFTIIRVPLESGEYVSYIADCTYIQFFTMCFSNPNRTRVFRQGVVNHNSVCGGSIGAYMTMTEERKQIAETILQKGYIEITPEKLKQYLDAFIYCGRGFKFYGKNDLDFNNPADIIPQYPMSYYFDSLKALRGIINRRALNTFVNELSKEEKTQILQGNEKE